jgi:hypothetical protein
MLSGLLLLGLFTPRLFLSLVWYHSFRSIYVLSRLGLKAGNILFTCLRTLALDLKLEGGESFLVRPVQFTGDLVAGFMTTIRDLRLR